MLTYQARARQPDAVLPRAEVADRRARFWFPVASRGTWAWSQERTRSNVGEYSWMAVLRLGEQTFEVGVSKFKHPASKPGVGTLEDLLQASQVNLWENTGAGSTVVPAAPIRAEVDAGGILVTIEDKRMLGLIANHRPETADFEIDGWSMPEAEAMLSTAEVPIRYENGRAPSEGS